MNKSSKWFGLGLGVVVVALTAALAPAAPQGSKQATLGEKAPAFTLKDMSGKSHSLKDFKGKTVVIEWTNPKCPFIEKSYGAGVVKQTVDAMKGMGKDYVYLAINSTANMPKDDVISGNTAFLKQHKLDSIPVLIDYDGKVGRMYGAKTTPHMYVIDPEGILRFHGAFTDDRGNKNPDRKNYVINALTQMANGETVTPDYVKPWGCSVKYAKK